MNHFVVIRSISKIVFYLFFNPHLCLDFLFVHINNQPFIQLDLTLSELLLLLDGIYKGKLGLIVHDSELFDEFRDFAVVKNSVLFYYSCCGGPGFLTNFLLHHFIRGGEYFPFPFDNFLANLLIEQKFLDPEEFVLAQIHGEDIEIPVEKVLIGDIGSVVFHLNFVDFLDFFSDFYAWDHLIQLHHPRFDKIHVFG